jgi:hypothetical protein
MKTYFNPTVFWLALSLILFMFSELYFNQFEQIIESEAWNMDVTVSLWWLSRTVCYLLVIAAQIIFVLFMRDSNKGLLFTERSSKRLVHVSILLIISGVLTFSYIRFGPGGSSLNFALLIFFTSLSYSFSNIFKEATVIKEEQALTI